MSFIQIPLADVQVGEQLAHIVRINSVKLIQGQKKAYLQFIFGDKSGNFKAKKWGERGDATEEERKKYEVFKVAWITGSVDEYNGNKDYKIKTVSHLAEDVNEQTINDALGAEPPPAQEEEKMENQAKTKSATVLFKTKAEIDFDGLVKSQRPLRECEHQTPLKHVLRVTSVTPGSTKSGTPVIDFTVGDISSQPLKARLWRPTDTTYEEVKNAKVVYIEGEVELYNGAYQVKFNNDEITVISDLTEADINAVTLSSPYSVKYLANGIFGIVQSFQDVYLKKLCESLLKDPKNKDFKFAPGGVTYHHSWRSGLIEHTYRLMAIVDDFVQLYNETPLSKNKVKLNRDAILTVCLYHDFFKCFEYTVDCGYAPAGNLLKHLSRGIVDVGARASQIKDFPKLHKEVIAHCIGAHHGKKEWDAIELPGCPEALNLHNFDNLCSKIDPTLTELNLLKNDDQFSTTRLKPLNSIPYIGSCKKEKPQDFIKVVVTEDTKEAYLSAIKEMLDNLKDPKLKKLCLRVFENNSKAYRSDSPRLTMGKYSHGLVEYIYRTMHFIGNFINSYNKHEWPTNEIYIDSDYSVAGAFLQSAYRFKETDPMLEMIGSTLLAVGEISAQIEGFSDELRNFICQIVASQGENSPESPICPDSITNHYYLPMIFQIDTMNLELSEDSWTPDTISEFFKKKIRPGLCHVEK